MSTEHEQQQLTRRAALEKIGKLGVFVSATLAGLSAAPRAFAREQIGAVDGVVSYRADNGSLYRLPYASLRLVYLGSGDDDYTQADAQSYYYYKGVIGAYRIYVSDDDRSERYVATVTLRTGEKTSLKLIYP